MAQAQLRVWLIPTTPGVGQAFKEELRPFLQQHPGVDVDLRLLSWGQAWSELALAFRAGDPPDVFQVGSTWVGTMAHLGYLEPVPRGLDLTPAAAPWIAQAAVYRGIPIAAPWSLALYGLVVRTDLLAGLQLDLSALQTWAGLLEACQQVAARCRHRTNAPALHPYPIAIPCGQDHGTLHIAASFLWSGGWHIDLATLPARILTHPSAAAGLEYLRRIWEVNRHAGANRPGNLFGAEYDFYQEGRFVFHAAPILPWLADRRQPRPSLVNPSLEFTLLPLPSGPCGSIAHGGGNLLAVAKGAKNAQVAWELVRYLTSSPFIDRWARLAALIPATETGWWEQDKDSESMARLRQAIAGARSYPQHPLWTSIESTLGRALRRLMWVYSQRPGDTDGETRLLAQADEQLNALLSLSWDVMAGDVPEAVGA